MRKYRKLPIGIDLSVTSLMWAIEKHRRNFNKKPNVLYISGSNLSIGKRVLLHPEFSKKTDAFFYSKWNIVLDRNFKSDEWCIGCDGREEYMGSAGAG